jgi:superfamily II DNA or RNA helicase
MRFDDLLSRCDVEVFQGFLGAECIRLLGLLDSKMSSPAFLRTLVVQSVGSPALLLKPETRLQLFTLLRTSEAQQLCQALSVSPAPDAYGSLSTCTFGRGATRETALFNFFELPVPPIETVDVPPTIQGAIGSYPLFDYQQRASGAVSHQLRSPPYRVLLHMPTGSGKTRTAMSVICDHLRNKLDTIVVWVAHSEELCDQAADEFIKAWLALGNRKVQLHRFWGPHDLTLESFHDGILVAGLSKLIRFAERNFARLGQLGARCSLVIIDEAHQSVAPEYSQVLEALLIHHAETALLGLSATPGRTWNDIAADEKLAIFFSRRKVSLSIPGFANPVDFLVQEGYLAKAEFQSLFYQGGAKLSPTDLQKLQASLDVPEAILQRFGEIELRNLAIVTKLEELAKRHQRIIVFAASVPHAHLLATVLLARKHDAVAVTTRTSNLDRSRHIDRFKSDAEGTMIICNYGVLTTGFDAPRTSCAVIARPTKSLVLYSQMVGRAIRGPKAGGNAQAEIVTVVDQDLPGFGTVAAAFANWEDIWTVPVQQP